jgi:hypothetical protein
VEIRETGSDNLGGAISTLAKELHATAITARPLGDEKARNELKASRSSSTTDL